MKEFQFRPSFIQIPALSSFNGEIRLPGSKSITNRAFLIAALAKGETRLHNLLRSDDTCYMGEALQKLGVKIEFSEDYTEAVKGEFHLRGEERMSERPIRDLVEALSAIGADISYEESEGYPPVCIKADGLKGGEVSVRGNISSQYLTALLICAPYCKAPLHIHVEGELISVPYVQLTLSIMSSFGIDVRHDGMTDFYVPQGVYEAVGDFSVEGDASSASYPLAAAAIAKGKVRVLGVGEQSCQGDVAFAEVLQKMGAKVTFGPDWMECDGTGCTLHGVDLDLNDIPDAAITVSVLALFADGPSRISGIASWRVKETDRIAEMTAELRKVGADVRETNDSITITPPVELQPATIETYNDHRMAMCFCLVALGGVPIKIMDPACVNKTYPQFFEDFNKLAK